LRRQNESVEEEDHKNQTKECDCAGGGGGELERQKSSGKNPKKGSKSENKNHFSGIGSHLTAKTAGGKERLRSSKGKKRPEWVKKTTSWNNRPPQGPGSTGEPGKAIGKPKDGVWGNTPDTPVKLLRGFWDPSLGGGPGSKSKKRIPVKGVFCGGEQASLVKKPREGKGA